MGSEACRRWGRCAVTIAAALGLATCGGSTSVSVRGTSACQGGTGPQLKGVVEMPHGRLAASDGVWRWLAGTVWREAAAITGAVSPVGSGIEVQLVELRQEDLDAGIDPGPVEIAETDSRGRFCIGLPEATDETVCRFMLRVGSSDDSTLTRAFVFGTADPIAIDYRSEATARVILLQIPPAGLCDFSPADIGDIYNAVVDAPGTATGSNADEINAVATSLALADPGVSAAVDAVVHPAD